MFAVLSYFDHSRCIRTSFWLNVYLLFTSVFDIARSRSYSLDAQLNQISILFTTRVAVKVFLAVFEARGKGHLLRAGYTDEPPEADAGVYSRSLFWWQNAMFKKGFKNTFSIDDLYQLDTYLRAEYLHGILQSAWDKGKLPQSWPGHLNLLTGSTSTVVNFGSNSLLAVTLRRLKFPILAVVLPRACLIAFNFCQPFLINRAVSYSEEAETAQTRNVGYGLIGAYIIVYVGIAVRDPTTDARWR